MWFTFVDRTNFLLDLDRAFAMRTFKCVILNGPWQLQVRKPHIRVKQGTLLRPKKKPYFSPIRTGARPKPDVVLVRFPA